MKTKETQIIVRLSFLDRQVLRQAAAEKGTTISNLVRGSLGLSAK